MFAFVFACVVCKDPNTQIGNFSTADNAITGGQNGRSGIPVELENV